MFEISSDHELHNFNHVFVKDEEGNLVRQKWTETDENTQTKWDYRVSAFFRFTNEIKFDDCLS